MGVPLIWIVISIGAFVFSMGLITNGYGDFMSNNGGTLDSSFMGHYYNISHQTEYYTNLSTRQYNVIDAAIDFRDLVFSGLYLFIGNIRVLTQGAKMSTDLISTTIEVFPWAGVLIGFLVFAITIYISYKFMQIIRGQINEI
jgi:hypothetical protein